MFVARGKIAAINEMAALDGRNIAMKPSPRRIIGWPVLRTMVPYTRQHVLKLEKVGRFPRRVPVGDNRVGWLLSEVEAWIDARLAERDGGAATRSLPITQDGGAR